MKQRVRERLIRIGYFITLAFMAASQWYSYQADSAWQAYEVQQERYSNYIDGFLRDKNSENVEEFNSIKAALDSAVAERDSLNRKEEVSRSAAMLALLALLAVVSITNLMVWRERNPDVGKWVGERNRAVAIATSLAAFFGILLFAPGIGEMFQGALNLVPIMFSNVGVPGLGQEMSNGSFEASTFGWMSIVAVVWLITFFVSFRRESD